MARAEWDRIKKLGGLGVLRRSDIADLDNQRIKVLYLMLDYGWHEASEVVAAAGGSEGLRRLRELREIPGMTVERERVAERRLFRYRLKHQPPSQGRLF